MAAESASVRRLAQLQAWLDTSPPVQALGKIQAKISLTQPAPALARRTAVVQRLSASVSLNVAKTQIKTATISGSAPATNLRGKRGDHTTAYVTFEHMAINNVKGKSLSTAVNNLVITLEQTKELPGYENAQSAYKKGLDSYADAWISYGEDLDDPTTDDVEKLMVAVVTLRNAVPGTAINNAVSTGGHGEASSAGGLQTAETKVRTGTWTKKSDFSGNPLVNVWKTFDFAAPGTQSYDTWAALLKQHMLSIVASYPHIFDIKKIYTRSDIESYLKTTVLATKFDAYSVSQIKAKL